MHSDLSALLGAHNISVEVIDIDADPVLLEQFDELVPVLIGHGPGPGRGSGRQQLCHYFLDVDSVKAFYTNATTTQLPLAIQISPDQPH